MLYLKREIRLCKCIFYGVQLGLLVCSICVAFVLKDTEFRNVTDYFFHVEYSKWNIHPLTRCAGFIIGYNLGIWFFNFKKMQERKEFWLIKRL